MKIEGELKGRNRGDQREGNLEQGKS